MARYDDDDDDDDRDDDEEEDRRPIKKKKKRGDPSEGGFMGFVTFRKFVGDWIIIIVFWILVAVSILGGLAAMVLGIIGGARAGGGGAVLLIGLGLLYGFLGVIVYPILLRIYTELIIIVYRILETLREIRDNTR
jgi:hypothetical protein